MKKFSFETIKKIDYVLILVAAIIAIIVFAYGLISSLIPIGSANPPQVKIVADDDEKTNESTAEHIDFYEKLKDTYIFKVTTDAIKASEMDSSHFSESKMLANSVMRSDSSERIVNFIFVKNGQEHKLFSSKAFVYKHQLMNEGYDHTQAVYTRETDFNVYAVVKEDSNADKKLDSKDNIALYISDYDGQNLRELSQSVYYVECLSGNICVFSEYSDGKVSFYEYNGNTKNVTLIKTYEKELSEKKIYLR